MKGRGQKEFQGDQATFVGANSRNARCQPLRQQPPYRFCPRQWFGLVGGPCTERIEPCRRRKLGYVCDDATGRARQRIAEQLVLGRKLACQPANRSWKRIVARGMLPDDGSLSCALIAAGAATRWDSYWRRYKMVGCR